MTLIADFDKAVNSAICGWLNSGGMALAQSAIVLGVRTPATAVVGLGAHLGLLALEKGCSFDPNNNGPITGAFVGCKKCSHEMVLAPADANGNEIPGYRFASIVREVVTATYAGPASENRKLYQATFTTTGSPTVPVFGEQRCPAHTAYLKTFGCTNCLVFSDGTTPGAPLPPVTYTTENNCELVLNFDSWLVGEDGSVRPVVKIAPAANALARATGGVIGGCNFNTVVHVGGGGGQPPWVHPWVDTPDGPDGKPWWFDLLVGAAGGLAAAAVEKVLEDLLTPVIGGSIYRLVSVCETNANGDPISQAVEKVIPAGKGLEVIAARLDALADIAQGLKDFKQPICPPGGPDPIGGWVTVNFQSSNSEIPSREKIQKVFSYRDPSDTPEADHVEHWRGFSWRTGPVVVSHTGGLWGRTTVWAETEAEGRRVIGHAAAIAGVDLATGSWKTHMRVNPRYGRVGTVWPVRWEGGNDIAVSKRAGPSGIPHHLRDL